MAKKKKDTLTSLAKDSIGLGIMSSAGLGAMGAIGNIPGMPSQAGTVTGLVGSGLVLANVGQTAKIGMTLPKIIKASSVKPKKSKKLKIKW